MKSAFLLILTSPIILSSCNSGNTEKKEGSGVKYNSPMVKEILMGFINSVSMDDSYNFLTISVTFQNDTTVLAIANTVPDFRYAHFQGYDTLNGYRLIYVNDVDKSLYTITGKQQVPKDIFELSNKMFNSGHPPTIDPKQWFCYFRNDTLLGFIPEEDIKKHVQIP
jgi:hypothetical protein